MMATKLNYQEQLETHVCVSCGISFAMPEWFIDARRKDKRSFYCPNGHSLSYTEGEADKLRKQLDAEKQRAEMFRRENQEKEKSIRALKGQITKTRNRIAKGVCPCCNRSFINLHRHMATKHPDYAPATESNGVRNDD